MLIVGSGDTTLDLRFDLGQFDPRITLTRASVATHFDSRGNLVVVQANEPRIDYDLKSGFCRGLLIEEARTNLVFPSAVLTTQGRAVTAVPHTLSFYGTGTVTLSGASTAGPLVGTGEQDRVSLTFTPSAGTLTMTVTGDVRLAQLEAGAFPTSYIPTTTVAVTRAAEHGVLPNAAWLNTAEGTLFGQATPLSSNVLGVLVQIDNNSTSERHAIYRTPTPSFGGITTDGGNTQANITGGSWIVGVTQRVVFAYKMNDCALFAAGTQVGAIDTSATMPTPDRLRIGSSGVGVENMNGHIRRLTYFPFRLPDGRLAEMTGPIGRVI